MLTRPGRIVTREMGISHSDFFRIFPAVIDRQPFERIADGVRYADRDRRLTIALSPEAHRRLGKLSIPLTTLRFEFNGYTGDEVEQFMERFDRHFHRGGG